MPVPENAIYRLAAALQRVAALEFDFRLNGVTKKYLDTPRVSKRNSSPRSCGARPAATPKP
jgi:hypothetical protein